MSLNNTKKIGIKAVISMMIFFAPIFGVFAADYVPLAPIPGTVPNCATPPCATNLSVYLVGSFKVGIALAGILAFLMIVLGGFEYLSTDAITGKEEGKARIERAIGGLILALTSYIILYTIDPKLVSMNFLFWKQAQVATESSKPADIADLIHNIDDYVASTNSILADKKATTAQLNQSIAQLQDTKNALQDELNGGDESISAEDKKALEDRIAQNETKIRDLNKKKEVLSEYKNALAQMKIYVSNGSQAATPASSDGWRNVISSAVSFVSPVAGALVAPSAAAQRELDKIVEDNISSIKIGANNAINAIDAASASTNDESLKAEYAGWKQTVTSSQNVSIDSICNVWGANKKSPPCKK